MRCRAIQRACMQRKQALANRLQMQRKKICLQCGATFTQIIEKVEFCSAKCEVKFFESTEVQPSELDEGHSHDPDC